MTLDADILACEDERIHEIGRVQDFGCLLVADSDWRVTRASTNCGAMLGHGAEDLIGRGLSEVMDREALHTLRGRHQVAGRSDSGSRIFALDVFGDGRLFNVALHATGQVFMIEFEPSTGDLSTDHITVVRGLIARCRGREQDTAFLQMAARSVAALSGFDRVMIYRFLPDESGEVVAEAMTTGREPLLGLRYPESDIPRQARELYRRNLLRLIADVNAPTHPILSPQEAGPVDLSLSVTRAVSPIHIEYLRNMGVAASMSASIIVKGRLWGLFACHHDSPRRLDFGTRTAVELFAELFANTMTERESDQRLAALETSQNLRARLGDILSEGSSLAGKFDLVSGEVGALIPSDGIVLRVDGQTLTTGEVPGRAALDAIVERTDRDGAAIFASDHLAGELGAEATEDLGGLAGALAMSLSVPGDALVLLRRDQRRTVRWGGDPATAKTVVTDSATGRSRLTPRGSFAVWSEEVRDRSAPWSTTELRLAEGLRVALLESALRLSGEAHVARIRAAEQQDILISELNHRVRNILKLIQSLIPQTRRTASSIDAFGDILAGRIQSLSRAHDQLTANAWSASPLKRLIEVEADAYLGDAPGRIAITGDEIHLTPGAFSTLALVTHELTTNAVKHGGLSRPGGRVEVTLRRTAEGAEMLWNEIGGPEVQPPTRRGFGSTIIGRSIPHELGGQADVDFRPSGLFARFTVPEAHLVQPGEETPQPRPAHATAEIPAEPLAGPALVVEDNMVIALDAADIMMRLGATAVVTAARPDEALRQLDSQPFALAFLDHNLGIGSSDEVARAALEKGIPTVVATGYAGTVGGPGTRPGVVVIGKPYDLATVREAVARAQRHQRRDG